MNKKEILHMPAGQDMDLLVAEEVLKLSTDEWNNRFFFSTGNKTKFSTDISAAWEVVEKLLDDEEYDFAIRSSVRGWHVTIEAKYDDYVANAETIPLAICRAALLARGLTQPAPDGG